jgi:hypothetical protein
LWYAPHFSIDSFVYSKSDNPYLFANDVTYANGKYTLSNGIVSVWDVFASSNARPILKDAHYTCLNMTGECNTIYYVYGKYDFEAQYIELSDGKTIEDVIQESLTDNQKNSTIKTAIDAWYKKNIIDFSDYIDDTIFCYDRSVRVWGGWNKNNGYLSDVLYFNVKGFICSNETDRFSVSNPKAQLTYKIGLMTYEEAYSLGISDIRKTADGFWLGTPYMMFFYGASNSAVFGSGNFSNGSTMTVDSSSLGVRPVISLKPGYNVSGDGSMENPYIINTD